MECGAGTMDWTREKSVVESNGGVCPNEKRMASGTTECYDCDKIGEQIQSMIKDTYIVYPAQETFVYVKNQP